MGGKPPSPHTYDYYYYYHEDVMTIKDAEDKREILCHDDDRGVCIQSKWKAACKVKYRC